MKIEVLEVLGIADVVCKVGLLRIDQTPKVGLDAVSAGKVWAHYGYLHATGNHDLSPTS